MAWRAGKLTEATVRSDLAARPSSVWPARRSAWPPGRGLSTGSARRCSVLSSCPHARGSANVEGMLSSRLSAVLPLLLTLGCATMGAEGGGGSGKAQAVGDPMPDLHFTRLDGRGNIRLSQLKGKVVLLDIWASWCAPCKEEMPLLDEMAGRLRRRGVEIIAVSVDEERANAEAFASSRPRWSLTLAHDPQGRIPDLLQPSKMPTSYVIDGAGVVRDINAGFERDDAPRIEARLRELADAR
jgi:thiol-disulfide isomerase/thioredoxin